MEKVGFIGVGVMGKSMVRNLMKNGFRVSIYTRTKEKVLDIIEEGVIWCDDIKTCVSDKRYVITIVGYPNDVEQVYFGDAGIIENANAGAYLIDMTTTSPQLSVEIYKKALEKGLIALDAPVSGGDVGAKNGTLSIMVGGEKEAFEQCMPVFNAMGTNIIYEGKAGSGQHTKMANQIAIAGALSGVCEAMVYAKSVGLDVETTLNSISKGAAGSWQMANNAPRILKGDYDPGFYIKHYIKDMKIASEESENAQLHLGVLNMVLDMFETLEREGAGDLGTQALIKYYDDRFNEE